VPPPFVLPDPPAARGRGKGDADGPPAGGGGGGRGAGRGGPGRPPHATKKQARAPIEPGVGGMNNTGAVAWPGREAEAQLGVVCELGRSVSDEALHLHEHRATLVRLLEPQDVAEDDTYAKAYLRRSAARESLDDLEGRARGCRTRG
jgi:hypothetical protein